MYFRGSRIKFSTTFKDADGNPTNPTSAKITIDFPLEDGSGRDSEEITMQQSGSNYTAEWDSAVAKAGKVSWSIWATSPAIVDDGFFTLTANPANNDAAAAP